MTDLREQVAQTLRTSLATYNLMTTLRYAADAALAVATPLIRAQVIEELAQKAEGRHVHYHGFYKDINEDEGELADWLRAQADDEPETRKIYIGFKGKGDREEDEQ